MSKKNEIKKMKLGKFILLFTLASTVVFTSCGGSGSKKGGGTKKFTSRTGWKPNDKKGWFFSKKNKKEKSWTGMVFVEGGTFTMGQVKDDVMHDWNNTPIRTQIRSFFIGETEVTNYEYREYVTWLKLVYSPTDENYKDIYAGALPDTLVWKNKLTRNDSYTESYFRAPQFDYYPVVGVSWLQAQRYCDWLTDRANEKALMDKGVISKNAYTDESKNVGSNSFNVEKYKYNDPSLDDMLDKNKLNKQTGVTNKSARVIAVNRSAPGNIVQKFRLPTEAEWEYAALAEAANREYNLVKGKEVEINKIRGTKGRNKGQFLDNFKYGRGDYSGIGSYGNDGNAIASDVRYYPSNEFGIYGMYGNVSEWTQDVYRPIIDEEASDFNYYRGNVYQQYIKSGDKAAGQFEKYADDKVAYDTLSDGRLIYKGLPGSYIKQNVEDARNYRDGDFQSSLDVGGGKIDSTGTYNSYNSPIRKFRVDNSGKVILDKDSKNRTTDVSNEVRVIKGGSWKDTAYWLDPAQRRYMLETESAAWLGFRVAQDHNGNETSGKRTKRGVNTKP